MGKAVSSVSEQRAGYHHPILQEYFKTTAANYVSFESPFVATWTAVVGLGTGLVHLFGFQAGWVSWFVTHAFLRLFWACIFLDLVFVF